MKTVAKVVTYKQGVAVLRIEEGGSAKLTVRGNPLEFHKDDLADLHRAIREYREDEESV